MSQGIRFQLLSERQQGISPQLFKFLEMLKVKSWLLKVSKQEEVDIAYLSLGNKVTIASLLCGHVVVKTLWRDETGVRYLEEHLNFINRHLKQQHYNRVFLISPIQTDITWMHLTYQSSDTSKAKPICLLDQSWGRSVYGPVGVKAYKTSIPKATMAIIPLEQFSHNAGAWREGIQRVLISCNEGEFLHIVVLRGALSVMRMNQRVQEIRRLISSRCSYFIHVTDLCLPNALWRLEVMDVPNEGIETFRAAVESRLLIEGMVLPLGIKQIVLPFREDTYLQVFGDLLAKYNIALKAV